MTVPLSAVMYRKRLKAYANQGYSVNPDHTEKMDMLSAKAERCALAWTAATQGEDAADALLDTRSDGLFEAASLQPRIMQRYSARILPVAHVP